MCLKSAWSIVFFIRHGTPVPPERVLRRPTFLGVASVITVSARFVFVSRLFSRTGFVGVGVCFVSIMHQCRKPHNKKYQVGRGVFLRLLRMGGLVLPRTTFFIGIMDHSDMF